MVRLLHFILLNACAVTLIQRVHTAEIDPGAETITALLYTHRNWNGLPDRNPVQCESSNLLTWVRKKICTAYALQTEYL